MEFIPCLVLAESYSLEEQNLNIFELSDDLMIDFYESLDIKRNQMPLAQPCLQVMEHLWPSLRFDTFQKEGLQSIGLTGEQKEGMNHS